MDRTKPVFEKLAKIANKANSAEEFATSTKKFIKTFESIDLTKDKKYVTKENKELSR